MIVYLIIVEKIRLDDLCWPRLSLEPVSLSFQMFGLWITCPADVQHLVSRAPFLGARRCGKTSHHLLRLASRNYPTLVDSFDETNGRPSCQRRRSTGVGRLYKSTNVGWPLSSERAPTMTSTTQSYHTSPPNLPFAVITPPRLPMARHSRASRLFKWPQPSATGRNGLRPSTRCTGAHPDMVLRRVHARPHSRVLWAKANTHAHTHDSPTCRLRPHAWNFAQPGRPARDHEVRADTLRKSQSQVFGGMHGEHCPNPHRHPEPPPRSVQRKGLKYLAQSRQLDHNVHWVRDRRWVKDRGEWSAAGITSGIDLVAEFARVYFDKDVVEEAKEIAEEVPKPDTPDPYAWILKGIDLDWFRVWDHHPHKK